MFFSLPGICDVNEHPNLIGQCCAMRVRKRDGTAAHQKPYCTSSMPPRLKQENKSESGRLVVTLPTSGLFPIAKLLPVSWRESYSQKQAVGPDL